MSSSRENKGKEVVKDEEIITSSSPESDSDSQHTTPTNYNARRTRAYSQPSKDNEKSTTPSSVMSEKEDVAPTDLNSSAPAVSTRSSSDEIISTRGTHSAEIPLRKKIFSSGLTSSNSISQGFIDRNSPISGSGSGILSSNSSPSIGTPPATPIMTALRKQQNLAPNYRKMRERLVELEAQGFKQFKEKPYGKEAKIYESKKAQSEAIPAAKDLNSVTEAIQTKTIFLFGEKSVALFRKDDQWYYCLIKELLSLETLCPVPQLVPDDIPALFVMVKLELPNGQIVRDCRVTLGATTGHTNLARAGKLNAGELYFGKKGRLLLVNSQSGNVRPEMDKYKEEYNIDAGGNIANFFGLDIHDEEDEASQEAKFFRFTADPRAHFKVVRILERMGYKGKLNPAPSKERFEATKSILTENGEEVLVRDYARDQIPLQDKNPNFDLPEDLFVELKAEAEEVELILPIPTTKNKVAIPSSPVKQEVSATEEESVYNEANLIAAGEKEIHLHTALNRASSSSSSVASSSSGDDSSPEFSMMGSELLSFVPAGKFDLNKGGEEEQNQKLSNDHLLVNQQHPRRNSLQKLAVPLFVGAQRRGSLNPETSAGIVGQVVPSKTAKLASKINSGDAKKVATQLGLASNRHSIFDTSSRVGDIYATQEDKSRDAIKAEFMKFQKSYKGPTNK